MALRIETKSVKPLLFIFNAVFWLAGTLVFVIGLWLRFNRYSQALFVLDNHNSLFYSGVHILIAAGALMMVAGFLGCCGAIQWSQWMLGLYFAFLLLIFALELAAGILALLRKEKIIAELQTFYKEAYTNYLSAKEESLMETLKGLHYALSCCGLMGSEETLLTEICPAQDGTYPLKTCPGAIDKYFRSKLPILGTIGIAIGLVMIFGMVFSMVLLCAIRNKTGSVNNVYSRESIAIA